MQIMIDSASDNAAYLRRVAKFLNEEADIRDQDEGTQMPPLAITPKLALVPQPVKIEEPSVDTSKVDFGLDQSSGSTAAIPQQTAPLPVQVPVAQVAPAETPAGAGVPESSANTVVERDALGMPWDARIHQAAKGKKVDETWKLKKGVDPALVATVTAELSAAGLSAPAPQTTVVAQPVLQQAPPPPVTQQVAPPPPSQAPAPVAQAVPSAEVTDFRKLMQKITAATNAGKLTNVQVDSALVSVGLPPRQLVALVQNADKVPGVDAYIDACLAAAA
jgi:hypothetical protein